MATMATLATANAPVLDIAEATGLSKRTVQSALTHLDYPRLIAVARASITSVPEYSVLRPWRS